MSSMTIEFHKSQLGDISMSLICRYVHISSIGPNQHPEVLSHALSSCKAMLLSSSLSMSYGTSTSSSSSSSSSMKSSSSFSLW